MQEQAGPMSMAPDVVPSVSEADVAKIAAVCHEANRTYCKYVMDDLSQPSWEEAPQWQRDSAIDGVQKALNGRRLFNKYDSRGDGQISHENWMEQKLRAGWRWGPVKDPEKKEHPSLLPYNSLTAEERRKDVLFLSICMALDPRRTA